MPDRNYLRRTFLGIVAFAVLLVAAGVLRMSDSPVLKVAGAVIAIALVLGWLISPFVDARFWERHAEKFPELLKNEAIGRTVTALDAFTRVDGVAIGIVELNGEKWKARCIGESLPAAGQALVVRRREGLTLDVQPQEGGG